MRARHEEEKMQEISTALVDPEVGIVELLEKGVLVKQSCKLISSATSRHMAHSLRLYLVPLHGDLFHRRLASSPHRGLASSLSCCLALDSSSSFPCPAFRAIAKSPISAPPSAATCYAAYPVILHLVFMAVWRLLFLLPCPGLLLFLSLSHRQITVFLEAFTVFWCAVGRNTWEPSSQHVVTHFISAERLEKGQYSCVDHRTDTFNFLELKLINLSSCIGPLALYFKSHHKTGLLASLLSQLLKKLRFQVQGISPMYCAYDGISPMYCAYDGISPMYCAYEGISPMYCAYEGISPMYCAYDGISPMYCAYDGISPMYCAYDSPMYCAYEGISPMYCAYEGISPMYCAYDGISPMYCAYDGISPMYCIHFASVIEMETGKQSHCYF
ncbi:hypothetical protein STEG23_022202 [Scotinomys teguina]